MARCRELCCKDWRLVLDLRYVLHAHGAQRFAVEDEFGPAVLDTQGGQ